MRYHPLLFLLCIAFSMPAWSGEKTVLEEKISLLIKQLGDEDYQARERATLALTAIGEPALPYLREAVNSKDPEIAWRAQEILRKILREEPVQNEKLREEIEIKGPGFQLKLRLSPQLQRILGDLPRYLEKMQRFSEDGFSTQQRSLTVERGQHKYEFTWNERGLHVRVTNKDKGTVEEHQVKDVAELGEKHPQLHDVYIDAGGNSWLQKFWHEIPPELWQDSIPDELWRELPLELQQQLRQLRQQLREELPKYYQFEERLKRPKFDFKGDLRGTWRKLNPFAVGEEIHGVYVTPVDPAIQAQFQLAEGEGLVVIDVADTTGLLARAGVERWDLLLKVDGATITTKDMLRKEVAVGKKLQIIRRGKDIELTIVE